MNLVFLVLFSFVFGKFLSLSSSPSILSSTMSNALRHFLYFGHIIFDS